MKDGNQYHPIAHQILEAINAEGLVLVVVSAENGDAASVALRGGNREVAERLSGMLKHVAERMEGDVAKANEAGTS